MNNNEGKIIKMNEEKAYQDQIEGRNPVLELLNSTKDINKIFISKGERHGSINKIIAIAKQKKIVIVELEKSKLDTMSETKNHQGVIAIVPPFDYYNIEDILEYAKSKNEDPFIIILDGIEDPHNLGSIIRTAECSGAHGVIIPKRRAAAVNATVNKAAARCSRICKNCKSNKCNRYNQRIKRTRLMDNRSRSRTEKQNTIIKT